jgi:hypothetical protein
MECVGRAVTFHTANGLPVQAATGFVTTASAWIGLAASEHSSRPALGGRGIDNSRPKVGLRTDRRTGYRVYVKASFIRPDGRQTPRRSHELHEGGA